MVKNKRLASILLAAFLSLLLVNDVRAETILITGNGSDSNNEVAITVTQETVVEQQNNSQVSNEVDVNANTGGNEVSENTGGENTVETGSSNTNVSIENENINSNSASGGCCEQETEIEISGNGSDSSNTVSSHTTNTTTVSQTNNAEITNSITTTANTGDNEASNNTGDVYISTGDIFSSTQIINKGINSSYSKFNSGSGYVNIRIKDNADGSNNNIEFVSLDDVLAFVDNKAEIKNKVVDLLNTGDNDAKGNTGGIYISTGKIISNIYIENADINSSVSEVSCDPCDEGGDNGGEDLEPPIPPSPPPPPNGGDGGNGGKGGGGGGNGSEAGGGYGGSSAGHVLAVAAGSVLPATGINWYLFALVANLFMFLMGLYLRLLSGRSPTAVLVG